MAENNLPDYNLTDCERKFADLIWDKEPVKSGDLVKLCAGMFGWKKSTTYTFLKKLCNQLLFQNKNAMVTSLISKEEYTRVQSERFVEANFGGSLPRFLTAFAPRKKYSKEDIDEILKMIAEFGEDK